MSKKLIIMIAAVGLVSFAGAFAFAWLTKPSPASRPEEPNLPTVASGQAEPKLAQPEASTVGTVGADRSTKEKAMSEKQLKNLVYEVQEKTQEYDNKLHALEVREQRLEVAQDVLKKDIEHLNNLRTELASIVASLRDERDKLLKSRVEIAQTEKANLVSIAATYDKMDASSASKILTDMCASQMQTGKVDSAGGSFDDAVKILHYMTERTKAKLLAELASSEPNLAAVLCQRLKQIVEGK